MKPKRRGWGDNYGSRTAIQVSVLCYRFDAREGEAPARREKETRKGINADPENN